MAEIISFFDRKKPQKREISRVEALAKGRIQHYSCDSCGADIEVINGEYPDRCPGCGLIITEWKSAADN